MTPAGLAMGADLQRLHQLDLCQVDHDAANLGAAHGVVGGLAYAAYWLSIPLAGAVIYWLRTRHGATGLVPFIIARYGRLAALSFALAILIRLYNEVWSNTAVVGAYYGRTPSGPSSVPRSSSRLRRSPIA